MIAKPIVKSLIAVTRFCCLFAPLNAAQIINNGGFDSGLTSWTTAN